MAVAHTPWLPTSAKSRDIARRRARAAHENGQAHKVLRQTMPAGQPSGARTQLSAQLGASSSMMHTGVAAAPPGAAGQSESSPATQPKEHQRPLPLCE
jgi:hypothetical protein